MKFLKEFVFSWVFSMSEKCSANYSSGRISQIIILPSFFRTLYAQSILHYDWRKYVGCRSVFHRGHYG